MKRFFLTIPAILTLLLCGCQTTEFTDASDYKKSISKAQEIAVISADTSEITETITAKNDIENFVLALEIENWELKSLPNTASEAGAFVFSQEQTIKFGQTNYDGTLSHIATITVYDSPYICLKSCGFDMTFGVSSNTINYLNGYFK